MGSLNAGRDRERNILKETAVVQVWTNIYRQNVSKTANMKEPGQDILCALLRAFDLDKDIYKFWSPSVNDQ